MMLNSTAVIILIGAGCVMGVVDGASDVISSGMRLINHLLINNCFIVCVNKGDL